MHEILHLLQHRHSSKKFGTEAPNAEQLEQIFKAALRAPDHGRMKPYHFVVIEKAQMAKFHQLLTACCQELGLGEEAFKKAEKLSQRAPMVIGVVAKLDHHSEKVPAWEQMICAGCATHAMQLAANAQGFDTLWITKHWINGSALRQAFGCNEGDKVIALLMIGSPPEDASRPRATEEIGKFVSYLS